MTSRVVLGLSLIFLACNAFAQANLKKNNAHIGLVYPLSTNWVTATEYSNKFSAHLLVGVSGSEQGFCASGFGNFIKYDSKGFTAAGHTNITLGNSKGFQAAGFGNYIKGISTGVQAAGFLNIGTFTNGVQGAGFANISIKDVRGAQLAGFFNLSRDVRGFQGSGYVNVARDVTGAQASGFVNVARNVQGAQVGGYVNVAKDVHAQVAAFVNVAKEVKSVQISGFVNISDSCAFPIGLVNISRKGEKFIGITVDDNLTTMATFRSGGKYLYGIVGAGANFSYNEPVYGLEAGLGAHIPIAKIFRINTEITTTSLTDFWDEYQFNSSFRLLPALKIGDRLEIFAGPTFSYEYSDREYMLNGKSNRSAIWENSTRDYYERVYIGGIAGIQFDL